MWEIRINKEIKEIMKKFYEKKATGPDGGIRIHIEGVAELIHDIIECSLKIGKVPK